MPIFMAICALAIGRATYHARVKGRSDPRRFAGFKCTARVARNSGEWKDFVEFLKGSAWEGKKKREGIGKVHHEQI